LRIRSPARELAERVGFEPLPVVENKELNEFPLPHDPSDPHESRGRDTYRAHGCYIRTYMAY
jgi:hypothetical protein